VLFLNEQVADTILIDGSTVLSFALCLYRRSTISAMDMVKNSVGRRQMYRFLVFKYVTTGRL